MGTVSYEVLGPLAVRRNGIRRDVGPEQRQRILAALLLRANQAVPLTDLIAAAWVGRPPADADQVVSNHIAVLRDLVDPQRTVSTGELLITLADGSYVLCVEPGDSDLDQFSRNVERAEELWAAGNGDEAGKLLRSALALWHGTPLEDLSGPLFDSARQELSAARSNAQESLARIEAGQQAATPAPPPAAYAAPPLVQAPERSGATLVVLKLLGAAVPVVTIGFLGWVVTAGVAIKQRSIALGISAAAYLAVVVWFTVYVMVPDGPEISDGQGLVTLVYLLAGMACSVQAAVVIGSPRRRGALQPPYRLQPQAQYQPQYQASPVHQPQYGAPAAYPPAPDAVRRQQARELARTNPAAARSLGIGRPDLPRQYDDGGLVDLNDAPADLLDTLPGVTGKQAAAIVVSRAQQGRFRTVDELSTRGLLPTHLLHELADRLVIIDIQD
ncbi:BTAD domain-containing putative transcriptional regulator [Kribbella sp. CA-293567]|uniref:BTAD domain-containing putative transcriptional regulator n=1 Tax=Kribbella sp. CA-293567 TaxID=3002436 RepID=UPI0022DCF7ED|nr:BTAD domain-containing putative transcriptional regulator [Kribbella sp. CA-293567]WBQ03950.1 BTAD domain-containing putative transcriptional regulator [Kribbella sp. CA-293567]